MTEPELELIAKPLRKMTAEELALKDKVQKRAAVMTAAEFDALTKRAVERLTS